MLINKSIREFTELIGSTDSPVPAGGAAAAVNGLLGVSLLKLACQVSVNKYKDGKADGDSGKTSRLSRCLEQLAQKEEIFLRAVDQDVLSYRLNQKSNFEDRDEIKGLNKTPLQIAAAAAEIIGNFKYDEAEIKGSVQADYQIGLDNLKAALAGSLKIIESNLVFFETVFADDPDYLLEVKAKLKKFRSLTPDPDPG